MVATLTIGGEGSPSRQCRTVYLQSRLMWTHQATDLFHLFTQCSPHPCHIYIGIEINTVRIQRGVILWREYHLKAMKEEHSQVCENDSVGLLSLNFDDKSSDNSSSKLGEGEHPECSKGGTEEAKQTGSFFVFSRFCFGTLYISSSTAKWIITNGSKVRPG